MIRYLIIVYLILIGFDVFAKVAENEEITKIINKIPTEDQECLEYLFRHMIVYQNFGYVLFGEKPMAWVQLYTKSMHFDKENTQILKYNHLLK